MKSEEENMGGGVFLQRWTADACHSWLHFSGLGSFTFAANHEQSCVEEKKINVNIAELCLKRTSEMSVVVWETERVFFFFLS